MTDFLCDTFSLWCPDHGEWVTHNATPEISGWPLVLAVTLLVGVLCIWTSRKI